MWVVLTGPLVASGEKLVLVERAEGVTHGRPWGPEQALGTPDTPGAGDIQTAWASKTPDGQNEWLEVQFEQELLPREILVHETYNPGSLYRITVYTRSRMEAEIWAGKDPTALGAARGVSRIKVDPGFKTRRVRIHLKSKDVPGWNEIDAVGVVDAAGKTHWPIAAKASSTYAEGPATGELPEAIRDKLKRSAAKAPAAIKPPAIKKPLILAPPGAGAIDGPVAPPKAPPRDPQAEISRLRDLLKAARADNASLRERQDALLDELRRALAQLQAAEEALARQERDRER